MSIFGRRRPGGKRLQKKPKSQRNFKAGMAALLLSLSMLAGVFPTPAAADQGKWFSEIVEFDSIALHYAGDDGWPGAQVPENALLKPDVPLALYYRYSVPENKISDVLADVPYYLDVSPHLTLTDLRSGSPLKIEDDGVEFGKIYADPDTGRAWVEFAPNPEGDGTVLSNYTELNGAYFYLDCRRAGSPPPGEDSIAGHRNLYAMKFENSGQLLFGYEEHEPVTAEAQIKKSGGLQDKTITWTIRFTPRQNPDGKDGIARTHPLRCGTRLIPACRAMRKTAPKSTACPFRSMPLRGRLPERKTPM